MGKTRRHILDYENDFQPESHRIARRDLAKAHTDIAKSILVLSLMQHDQFRENEVVKNYEIGESDMVSQFLHDKWLDIVQFAAEDMARSNM